MLNVHKIWLFSYLCVVVIVVLYFQAEISSLEDKYQKLEYKLAQKHSEPRQFFPKLIEKVDDDLVVIYNRVPKTGSTSFVGVAYDLCKKNHFKVLHINITANMHVMSLSNQYKFAQNVTRWNDVKPALYHGHMAFLNFERHLMNVLKKVNLIVTLTICGYKCHFSVVTLLNVEQNNEELESTGGPNSRRESTWAGRATPPAASFPMQNSSHVKFEPPNVPVIFVLDMQDFGTLSSKTVTEVLMLEMKMAPTAKTYLIQTISGVVLVSWRQRVLERQIEYGARLGHVVLSLARMELANFYRRVMPVADYFDQSNMLVAMRFEHVVLSLTRTEFANFYRHVMPVADYYDQSNLLVTVNGERNPEEVYKDFRAAVLQILGTQDDQTTMNGVSGVGVGAGGIPGEIVGVEPAPTAHEREEKREERREERREEIREETTVLPVAAPMVVPRSAILMYSLKLERSGLRNLGQRLRALADAGGGPATDGALARSSVSGGEQAPRDLVSRLVTAAVNDAARTGNGLILDGYPRDIEQLELFQKEVDGDTDSAEVQEEFTQVLLEEMEKAEAIAAMPEQPPTPRSDVTAVQQFAHAMSRMGNGFANGAVRNGTAHNGTLPNGNLPNGTLPNGTVKPMVNNVAKIPTVSQMTHDEVRRLYENSSGEVTMDTHM
ncbi:unnamed protein product [Chilo suppressalis]|uniref:Guanylate kinase-like domain-containing protein n=1 Tax=Chilo suppressalis TaxID=168631 RepID=A0ABN8BDR9_CHISP|nr:unnamed protein product [Chilo suppressalis]